MSSPSKFKMPPYGTLIIPAMVLIGIAILVIVLLVNSNKNPSKESYIFSEYDGIDRKGCADRFMNEYAVCSENGDPLGDCWDMTKHKLSVCKMLWDH